MNLYISSNPPAPGQSCRRRPPPGRRPERRRWRRQRWLRVGRRGKEHKQLMLHILNYTMYTGYCHQCASPQLQPTLLAFTPAPVPYDTASSLALAQHDNCTIPDVPLDNKSKCDACHAHTRRRPWRWLGLLRRCRPSRRWQPSARWPARRRWRSRCPQPAHKVRHVRHNASVTIQVRHCVRHDGVAVCATACAAALAEPAPTACTSERMGR